ETDAQQALNKFNTQFNGQDSKNFIGGTPLEKSTVARSTMIGIRIRHHLKQVQPKQLPDSYRLTPDGRMVRILYAFIVDDGKLLNYALSHARSAGDTLEPLRTDPDLKSFWTDPRWQSLRDYYFPKARLSP
ncbi:MAG: hypothetical protein ACRCZF_10910, partial [Gemmataceae bacterium]